METLGPPVITHCKENINGLKSNSEKLVPQQPSNQACAASYPRKGCQALTRIIVSRGRHECSTRVV